MKTIKIGKDRELLFNLWAIQELKKKYGSLEKMSEAISKGDPLDSVEDIAFILTTLMNAFIKRRNQEIVLGFAEGEKEPMLTPEIIKDFLDYETLKGFPSIFGDVVSGGYATDIPEKEEEDEVLKELNAKNA